MRNILFTILFLSGVFNLRSSDTLSYYVKQQNLSEINASYIEAVLCPKPFSTRIFVEIDHGQEMQFFNFRDRRLAYRDGTYVEFNSRMAAINYLIGLGYEIFDNQYLFDASGDVSGQRLLLKRSGPSRY